MVFHIKQSFKHFIVRLSLGLLRFLIFLKRISGSVIKIIFQPFRAVLLILLKWIGVPIYRGVFFLRRFVNHVLLPAKHRFFYLLSNRYSIHIFVITLVLIVGVANLKAHNVRAETFGQNSILYSLVSSDDSEKFEVVEAGKTSLTFGKTSSYLSDTVLDSRLNSNVQDFDQGNEEETIFTGTVEPVRDNIQTYTVEEGDTLGKIAVRFNLSISTILSANQLSLRSTIRPGDELKVLPGDGVIYKVVSGDTISKIARRYQIESSAILKVNRFLTDQSLQIGSELFLPGAQAQTSQTQLSRRSVSVKDIFNSSPSAKYVSGGGWVWPTNWHVITQYFNWKHTGIDIDGDYSTFSFAAQDGVVSYSGWRRGYGLTVEVDHGNGLKTRYGHNSKNLVSVGDVVSAGDRLAKTGSTGRSTGTHLHFEVMKNGKFQNPLDYVR